MAKEDQSEPAAQTESTAPKKSKIGLILIVLVILMAGAAGFFGWQYFKNSKANASAQADSSHEEEEAAESQKPKHDKGKSSKSGHKEGSDGTTINFEPFLVNLADKDVSRYLRATIRVVVASKETAERITSGEVLVSKIRDAILNILCTKISTDIVTSEGKEKLKKEILQKLNSFVPEEPAQDVFFTDFVVQL
jgi:flagellar FliL protein